MFDSDREIFSTFSAEGNNGNIQTHTGKLDHFELETEHMLLDLLLVKALREVLKNRTI